MHGPARIPSATGSNTGEAGFTLLEAVIAFAIVILIVTSILAIRTNALIDAAEARNWRVAREVAQEIFSELRAGARDEPPEYDMSPRPIPTLGELPGWSYQIVIGETNISSKESDIDGSLAPEESGAKSELRRWQQERDDQRRARSLGVSFFEYQQDTRVAEEERLQKEELVPSEDEFEEVAVFVFFPNVRPGEGPEFSHFVLKGRLPTLAIEGLTPEEAEEIDKSGTAPTGTTPMTGSASEGGSR